MLNTQPQNFNALSPINFRLILKRLPKIVFNCTALSFPGLYSSPAEQIGPFTRMYEPGHKITHDPLAISFIVDEDMDNYFELHEWITALGFEEGFTKYADLAKNHLSTGEKIKSDATLIIDKSSNKPNIAIDFYDVFPIALQKIDFNAQLREVEAVSCVTEFQFRNFKRVRSV